MYNTQERSYILAYIPISRLTDYIKSHTLVYIFIYKLILCNKVSQYSLNNIYLLIYQSITIYIVGTSRGMMGITIYVAG